VISVTFDNLGEVADLERGRWPAEAPLGRHASVTRTLPRILELLDEVGVRATFFVEGLNTELYPDALLELDARRHEVACHGWRHERWAELDPQTERERLRRSVDGMRALGLQAAGFQPPGGELTPATPALLRDLGFTYCSPAAGTPAGGMPALPFRWELLDAYHYLPHFAAMRGTPEPLPPGRLRETLLAALEEPQDQLVLLFHPFLADTAERLAVLVDVLARVRELVEQGAVACAPCRELA